MTPSRFVFALCSSLSLLQLGCAASASAPEESTELSEYSLMTVGMNGLVSSDWSWSTRPFRQTPALPDSVHTWRNEATREHVTGNGSYPYASKLNLLLLRNGGLEHARVEYRGEPMSKEEWDINAARAGKMFGYFVTCALPSDRIGELVIVDASGAGRQDYRVTSSGSHALAPQWEKGRIQFDWTAQMRITGCVAAYTNKYGTPLQISLRSVGSDEGTDFAPEYPTLEGAYWGNMFDRTPDVFTCDNADAGAHALSLSLGRACHLGHCGNVHRTGNCADVCQIGKTDDGKIAYHHCKGKRDEVIEEVVTTYIGEASMREDTYVSGRLSSTSRRTATCNKGTALLGISVLGDELIRDVLCKQAGPIIYADQSVALVGVDDASTRRSERKDDWHPGATKLECAEDEYIAAVGADKRVVEGISCKRGNVHGDLCRVIPLGGSDPEGIRITSGEWSLESGAQVAQCGLGEHAAGLAVAQGKPRSLLCCLD